MTYAGLNSISIHLQESWKSGYMHGDIVGGQHLPWKAMKVNYGHIKVKFRNGERKIGREAVLWFQEVVVEVRALSER